MNDWLNEELDRPYHEVAQLFPLMLGDGFEQLKADVAANGLLEVIWLHPDGSILDGRNRHRACIEMVTRPRFRTWGGEGSLVGFVVSMNLHRRHLTSSRRAVVALEMLPMLEAEAKKRQRASGGNRKSAHQKVDEPISQPQATQQAAKLAHTNRQYVSDAKKLQQEAPDLLTEVKEGKKANGVIEWRGYESTACFQRVAG